MRKKRKEIAKRIWEFTENPMVLCICLIVGSFVIGHMVKENFEVISPVKDHVLPIYSVEREEKEISLTFDSAWSDEDFEDILAILDRQNVRATFFVTGDFVSRYPNAIKKLDQAGHDIGSHGDNHKHMTRLSKEENIIELKGCFDKVKAVTGKEMDLFRAPYGDYNEELVQIAKENGYYTIQWDVDSLDWKDYGVNNIIQTVTEHKNLQNGSILLLHNGAKYTKDALEPLIIKLKEQGYQFVPVSELIYRENYYMDHTGRQIPQ